MPGGDDDLVDLVQQFGGKQHDVVFERLKRVRLFVTLAMTEHLAKGAVLIDEFLQAVVVDIQIEPDDTADQNRPEGHAGTTVVFVDLGCDLAGQQCKHGGAQRGVGVEVLQTAQNLRDVVAGAGIEDDPGDVYFADAHLLVLDDAHGLIALTKHDVILHRF